LKSRKLIGQIFDEGESFVLQPFKIFYLFTSAPVSLQAGFTVSSKNFKRAVDRNRIKRLGREAYRLQKKELAEKLKRNNQRLAIFFVYIGKGLPDHQFVHKKMSQILEKLGSIIDEKNSPNN